MAERPIFIPAPDDPHFVKELSLSFRWHPGLAASQKKKNIEALHTAATMAGYSPVLEISTKSDDKLGRHLSAFHLSVRTHDGPIPLESAFQGSKVFERGGPYTDLYRLDAREAKRDPRIRESGQIVGFRFFDVAFPTTPKTVFYDWLYINAIFEHREWLHARLPRYAGFSDIEFNPERSINCQARSCAVFAALLSNNLLEEAVSSPDAFVTFFKQRSDWHLLSPTSLPR
jgi:hypothetical protein